jgi:hypothetical protein
MTSDLSTYSALFPNNELDSDEEYLKNKQQKHLLKTSNGP